MGFDLFDLLLTSGTCGTLGACPVPLQAPPVRESVFFLGQCFWPVGLEPRGKEFVLFLIIWLIPIHNKMIYSLGVGYSGGG